MKDLGNITEDGIVDFKFNTIDAALAPITLAGTPAVSVYKANSTTQSMAGVTLTVDFDGVTGLHHVRIDTSADSFYATGNDYEVVITAGMVDGVSVVGAVVARFSIENRFSVATALGAQAKADVNNEADAAISDAALATAGAAAVLDGKINTMLGRTRLLTVQGAVASVLPINGATVPSPLTNEFHVWRRWLSNRWLREARDRTFTATFYVSSSTGDDGNPGTEAEPWETMGAIEAHAAANPAGAFKYLLKRGDVWAEDLNLGVGLSLTGNFYIGAYGVGADPKLWLWDSTGLLDADDAWSVETGDYYSTAYATEIGWLRLVDDPYNPLQYVGSEAACAATPFSFHWDSGTLFVNLGGDDPNDFDIEVVPEVNDNNGILVATTASSGATFYVGGIHVEGFGVRIGDVNPNGTYSFRAGNLGDDCLAVFEGCTGFFAERHVFGHTSGGTARGRMLIKDCVGGYCTTPAQTIVGYSDNGGHSMIVDGFEFRFARLPSTEYSDGVVNHGACDSSALISHTTGSFNITSINYSTNVITKATHGLSVGDWIRFRVSGGSMPGGLNETDYFQVVSVPSGNEFTVSATAGGSAVDLIDPGGSPTVEVLLAHELCLAFDLTFSDMRATLSRATYEAGLPTSSGGPGDGTLDRCRTFFQVNPVLRLAATPANLTSVSIDGTTEIATKAAHGLETGDIVTVVTEVSGNWSDGTWRTVLKINADTFYLANTHQPVTSFDDAADTITSSGHGMSNGDRVALYLVEGFMPSGLVEGQIYYAVGVSGAAFQVEETPGGGAVNFTGRGTCRLMMVARVFNATTATRDMKARKVRGSSPVRWTLFSQNAVYFNSRWSGLMYGGSSGTTPKYEAFQINCVMEIVNASNETAGHLSPGQTLIGGHYRFISEGAFRFFAASLSTNRVFASVVDVENAAISFFPTNDAAMQLGNAIWDAAGDVMASITTADTGRVLLSAQPVILALPTSQFDDDGTAAAGGFELEYDFNEAARNIVDPSIGPVDVTGAEYVAERFVVADLMGDVTGMICALRGADGSQVFELPVLSSTQSGGDIEVVLDGTPPRLIEAGDEVDFHPSDAVRLKATQDDAAEAKTQATTAATQSSNAASSAATAASQSTTAATQSTNAANALTAIGSGSTKVTPIDVDGLTHAKAMEVLMAVILGVGQPSGSTVVFKKRDGTTTTVTITYGSASGERIASVIA